MPKRANKRSNNSSKKSNGTGKFHSLPPRPKDLTPRPWYPLTVRISTLTGQTLNFETVISHLSSQLGLGTAIPNLSMRLQHIQVWGPVTSTSSNTTTGQLHIRVYDPITNQSTQEQIRYPDVVNRASFGYRYSDTVRQTPVGTLANTVFQFLSPAAAQVPDCVIYIHVLWRIR